MTCEFGHDDAAYVLGALSPAERSAYQAHLAGCAECTRAVQELAGLPGLLGRVSAEVLEPADDEPLPDTLLPELVRRVRTRRRRTRVALGAVAAAVVVGGSLVVGLALDDDPQRPTDTPGATDTPPAGDTMVPVGSPPMSANLALTGVAWGTRLDLTCSYREADEAWGAEREVWSYVMLVRTSDGRVERVASWRAVPGETMRLAAATAALREDIRSVEIRTATGQTVLTLVA